MPPPISWSVGIEVGLLDDFFEGLGEGGLDTPARGFCVTDTVGDDEGEIVGDKGDLDGVVVTGEELGE